MESGIILHSSNLKQIVLKNISNKKKINYKVSISKPESFSKHNILKAKKNLDNIEKNINASFQKIKINMNLKDKKKIQTEIIEKELEKYVLTSSLPYIKQQKFKIVIKKQ